MPRTSFCRILKATRDTILRSLGLYVLVPIGRRAFNRVIGQEKPKVLIPKSKWYLVGHCAVHFLPVGVSLAIIGINMKGGGFFIGNELEGRFSYKFSDAEKLGWLQVAAKVQELLIMASFSTAIMHVLHTMLVTDQGVPLGLMGSGSAFAQFSYLWSVDLWGGILSSDWDKRHKNSVFLLVLVFIGCLMSLFAGPATAITMIPRSLDWPVGGGLLWLTGNETQLWPNIASAEIMGGYSCTTSVEQLYDASCPSAGYLPLYQFFYSKGVQRYLSFFNFEYQDQRIRKTMNGHTANSDDDVTLLWTPHVSTALHHNSMRVAYESMLNSLTTTSPTRPPWPQHLGYAEKVSFDVDTRVPQVKSSVITNWTLDDARDLLSQPLMVPFPAELARTVSFGVDTPLQYNSTTIDVSTAVRQSLKQRGITIENGTATLPLTQLPPIFAVPVELTAPDFEESEFGIVWFTKYNNMPGLGVSSCTINSTWVNGTSFIASTNRVNRWNYDDVRVPQIDVETGLDFGRPKEARNKVLQPSPIDIKASWFDLLSPVLPDSAFIQAGIRGNETVTGTMPNRSLLERLLEITILPHPGQVMYPLLDELRTMDYLRSIEVVVGSFFVDGLSRSGSHLQENPITLYNTAIYDEVERSGEEEDTYRKYVFAGQPVQSHFQTPAAVSPGNSYPKLMKAIFTGYAMAAQNGFEYAWIVVLCVHILVVLVYSIWAWVCSCGLITAWDTNASMLALAHNSEPSPNATLQDTCAGIRAMSTLGRVAVVKDCSGITTPGKEELQLRFQSPSSSSTVVHPATAGTAVNPTIGMTYGAR